MANEGAVLQFSLYRLEVILGVLSVCTRRDVRSRYSNTFLAA